MSQLTRRQFVVTTGSAVMTSAPAVFAGSPSNRVVLALMGAGGRGMDVIRQAAPLPDVTVKNVAYRSGSRSLVFDAATESFVDCPAANRLLKPAYRDGYRVPEAV